MIIRLNSLKNERDIDNLIMLLETNYYKSYVKFDDCIELNIDRDTKVSLPKIQIYDKVHFKNYYDLTEYYFNKLRLRLISELKINKTFVNLLHVVRFFELDLIKIVDEEELKLWYREGSHEYDENNVYELLGYYIGNRIIICAENIDKCINSTRKNQKLFNLYKNHLLEKVFNHEYGHHIFLYRGEYNHQSLDLIDSTYKEKQANYFSSFAAFGIYDELIYHMSKNQPSEYKNPILYTSYATQYSDFDNSDIKKLYIRKPINKIVNNLTRTQTKTVNNPVISTTVLSTPKVVPTINKPLSRAEIAKQALIEAYKTNKLKVSDVLHLEDENFCSYNFNFRKGFAVIKKTISSNKKERDRYQVSTKNKVTLFGQSYYFSNDFGQKKLNLFLDYIRNL